MKQKLNLFIAYPAIKLTQKENTFLDTTVHQENDSKKKLFTILRTFALIVCAQLFLSISRKHCVRVRERRARKICHAKFVNKYGVRDTKSKKK